MDGWMDGWMNGWMDEWMDGWMDGRYVYMYKHVPISTDNACKAIFRTLSSSFFERIAHNGFKTFRSNIA